MRLTTFIFLILCFFSRTQLYGQLADGSIAPNWTLTDINGNSHTLYNLLDQGKMVVIEFSATWCGPCWNYMQTGALESFWDAHGPNGANDAQVFYIEADWSTGMADLLGQTGSSQGNWVANIDFPIIDLAPGNQTANQYEIAYYPTLFAVCHDRTLYELGQVSANTWSNFIQSCNMEASPGNIQPALCAGQGSASVNATGGFLPYSYHWSNGASTQTITGLSAGTFQVTVTEAHGKISKVELTVPGASTPLAISGMSVEPALCFGSSNGQINISVNGGVPGYHYHWSNGASSQDLPNVPAGTYGLTITDNNGCTLTQSFMVDEPDELEATAEITPDNCDQGDGTITLDISGGVGNYEISSSEGNVNGDQIINLQAGFVTVEVNDENGCVWTDQFEIGFQNAPELDLVQGPDLNCIQLTTTITGFPSGGYGNYDYHWTTTNGHIASNPNVESITVDQPGTYQLQITDDFSGCITIESQMVDYEGILPAVEAGQGMEVNCELHQVNLAGSGEAGSTISWTTSNGHIVSGANTFTPLVDAAGIYYLNVFNPVTHCSNLDSVAVSDVSNPALAGFQYVSSGLSIATTDISTGSNLSGWHWTFGDSTSSGDQNAVHTYAAPGSYEVCLTVQNGCGANQICQMVTVDFTAGVIVAEATITHVLCHGQSNGSIVLNVNGGSGNYTYNWIGPDTTYTTSQLQDIPAGSYQLVLTDDLGNIFIQNYVVNEPSELILAGSTIVDNQCFGDANGSLSLTISGGVSPYLYSWNGSAPQSSNIIEHLPAGIVLVMVTDAIGCVFVIDTFTISQPSEIQPEAEIVNVRCHGESDGSIGLSTTGGNPPYTFLWSFNGSTTSSITGLSAGTYINTITDANGCTHVFEGLVSEPDAIGLNSQVVVNASGADEHDGSITIEPSGGTAPYQILWSNGATGPVISGLAPGLYSFVITDANGCMYSPPESIVVSITTGVNQAIWPSYITIRPNPGNGNVIIKWNELNTAHASLSVLNTDGKLIAAHQVVSTQGEWDLSNIGLTQGLYIVLFTQDNQVSTFRLIIL